MVKGTNDLLLDSKQVLTMEYHLWKRNENVCYEDNSLLKSPLILSDLRSLSNDIE